MLADDCDTEEEYLAAAEKMAESIKTFTPDRLDDFLFNEVDDISALPATLDKILENTARVREIPEEKRTYEF